MLDDVRDEDFLPIDSSRLERLIEECSSRSDKRMPCFVLIVARRFADQDHSRCLRSFTADGLCRPTIQLTTATGLFSMA
jgi:hypothetical protein